MAYKVVAVCGDPGGAASLAPVIEILASEPEWEVEVFAYFSGLGLLRARGLSCEELPPDPSTQAARTLLETRSAGILLTATSSNGWNWEHFFTLAARDLGIRSVALLDFWSNYARRFSDSAGDLRYLPDRIAVMDQYALKEMAEEGFPTQMLEITGQPAFDCLAQARAQFDRQKRQQIRSAYGVAPDGWLVVFASQPLREVYGSESAPLGYDERHVLDLLIVALENIQSQTQRAITLVVRPHPREKHIQAVSQALNVRVVAEGGAAEWAMSADLVAGMNSVLLLEACLLGCAVVSLQPGLLLPDCLPSNAWGASQAVYDACAIEPTVRALLENAQTRENLVSKTQGLAERLPEHAARNVVDLLRSEISV